MKLCTFAAFSLVIVLFLNQICFAKTSATVIAPANGESSGCDLAVPGIDKRLFQDFFEKLKPAAAKKDADAMAALVIFPLLVNSEPKKTISNTDELKRNFTSVFTDKILSSIAQQKMEKLFCRDQGVMIGSGEVWIEQKGSSVGIFVINP